MPDNAIWAVTGPEHDARMARELAWIATGGQTGIVGPESLEVRAQNTPNNTVRIMPGGFSISATSQQANIGYTSAPWQSYMRAVYQPIDVEIDATSSSGGRTDVVGIVVDDPEFEGTSPDVDAHQYWRTHVVKNAGNNATRPEHFASLGRPFLPLAQVRLPSSTATVTNSMIQDIRFLAVSRSEVRNFVDVVNDGSSSIILRQEDTSWTTAHSIGPVRIPQWARRCQVVVMVGPLYVVNAAANGDFRLSVVRTNNPTRWNSTPTRFIEPDPNDQVGGSPRFYVHTSADIGIPANAAGGVMDIDLQFRRAGRPGSVIIPGSDTNMCRSVVTATFEEVPRRTV